MIYQGDCLAVLKTLEANTVDSLVTDPPAGISFMGKDWDGDKGGREQWVAWMTEVMAECRRVLKPGAHGLVWALPRTSHWTATALENAGFEVRDVVTHLFGTGFPKSFNLGNGWGTALKPASEHWILVRKPCSEKTVAKNVLKHGTGGINIDGCRIELKNGEVTHGSGRSQSNNPNVAFGDLGEKRVGVPNIKSNEGRFPANLVLDEFAAQMLDEQSGECKTGSLKPYKAISRGYEGGWGLQRDVNHPASSGGASRFFYVAKASKADRNAGLEGMPEVVRTDADGLKMSDPRMDKPQQRIGNQNFHPTVKSTKLMSYLCRLVTPPGGTILDPFTGSGSTGVAANIEGFEFIGIEQDAQYIEIAKQRIAHAGTQEKSCVNS